MNSISTRYVRWMVWVALLGVAVALPWILVSPPRVTDAADVVCYAVAILGLNLLMGYTGEISIGHSAFMGVGAYSTLILVSEHGWPYIATLPVSMAVAFVLGFIIGLPSLRISGLYFAALTLGFGLVFPLVIDKFQSITGGPIGLFPTNSIQPPRWIPLTGSIAFRTGTYRYWIILLVAGLLFLMAHNMLHSRTGRSMIAVREAPLSAAASGIWLAKTKTIVFAVSASFAAASGSLLMFELPVVNDTTFSVILSIFLVVALIVGGMGSLPGAVAGGFILMLVQTFIPNYVASLGFLSNRSGGGGMSGVLSGIVMLAVIFTLPGGLADGGRYIKQRWLGGTSAGTNMTQRGVVPSKAP